MTLMKFAEQVPSMFGRFFDDDLFDWPTENYSKTNTTLPAVNIKEDTDGYEVEIAAPGFDKSDFKIELARNVLTVSSEKQVDNETREDQQFTRQEFSYQSFRRSFTLPNSVEGERIMARYENGILKIGIPKKEEAKPRPPRQIAIN